MDTTNKTITASEIAETRRVIGNYYRQKKEMRERADSLREDVKKGIRKKWVVEAMIDDMYRDLSESPNREEFGKMAKKTETDSAYEAVFRTIFNEIFP